MSLAVRFRITTTVLTIDRLLVIDIVLEKDENFNRFLF